MRCTPIALVYTGAIGALTLVGLSGCAPTNLTALPAGVSVTIQQNRDDYGPRRLEVVVSNESDEALTVTGASFDSGAFAAPATWERPATIDAGTTTNLRVQLAAADCEAVAASVLAATVTLDFALPDGATGSATVTPEDPFDAVSTVTAQDCAADAVARVVDIAFAPELRTEKRNGELVALVDLVFSPTGGGGSATVERVSDTILVRSSASDGWGVDRRFTSASAPYTATLDFIPNNCRLHTVAEDKRGTYFPVTATLEDGTELTFPVAASTQLKQQVYEYIAEYCGWE